MLAIPVTRCGGIQLSPDGRLVTVSYVTERPDAKTDLRVADTQTGEIRSDVLLGSFSASKEPILFQNRRTRGIAWIDNHTVRVAWTGPDPTNALEVRAVTVTGQ